MGAAHERYPRFVEHGGAETYRRELARLRKDFEDLRTKVGED